MITTIASIDAKVLLTLDPVTPVRIVLRTNAHDTSVTESFFAERGVNRASIIAVSRLRLAPGLQDVLTAAKLRNGGFNLVANAIVGRAYTSTPIRLRMSIDEIASVIAPYDLAQITIPSIPSAAVFLLLDGVAAEIRAD